MLASAEPAKNPRAHVGPERGQLLALRLPSEQIAGRGLAVPAAPPVERVEADQRHENTPALHFELTHLLAAQADRAFERNPLERRNRRDALPLRDWVREEAAN